MIFETISLIVAFVGSSIAAAWDLKTTEIPDQIPHAMIVIGLILYGVQSVLQWDYWPIVLSSISGLSLLGLGFLMYYFGQWGGGDAKILSAMGFLLPFIPSVKTFFPFPLTYLTNVFLIGAGYMLIYALVFAFMNKKILTKFFENVKASSNVILLSSIGLFILFFSLNFYLSNYFQFEQDIPFLIYNSLLPLILTVGLFLVWKFAKAVEDFGFKRKIPVSKLKVGDVLLEYKKWEGITQKDLDKIKRSRKKFVWIKEGIRFGMSFPLALVFTLYFGDGILLFVKFLI